MIIGITGSFGSGKSTVSGLLSQRGAIVLDADEMVHQCTQPGQPCYDAVIRVFGHKVVGKDRWIDRGCLAKIVFSNPKKLKKLCGIIHPCVKNRLREAADKILRKNSRSIIVFDVPLLIESKMDHEVDFVIVATTTIKKQTERAMERFGLTEQEALQRIQAQLPLQEKTKRSDFVISTSGTLDETKLQVEKLCQKLKL